MEVHASQDWHDSRPDILLQYTDKRARIEEALQRERHMNTPALK